MFKDTCLISLKRKDWSPHILALEILVYFIVEVFHGGFGTIILTLNHTIKQMQQS
jgi:hypothetical protein